MLKHRLTLFLAMIALFFGASLPSAAADALYASIPFNFVVQGVTYPAGTYRVISTSSPQLVIVRNEANLKQSFMMLLPTGESVANGNARLILRPKSSAPLKAALQGGQK